MDWGFYELTSARHCVRQFTTRPIDHEVLERIVHAAGQAPSSENEQPWRFYVTSGAARERLGEAVGQSTRHLAEYMDVLGPEHYERAAAWFTSLGDAPVLIGVSVPDSPDDFKRLNRLLSVGAALQSLLLAATEEGLGACPFTFSYWVKDEIAQALDLPAGETVVCVVALGWPVPTDVAAPARRSDIAVWLD